MASPPVGVADVASVTENTTLVATGNVLGNDSDPDGGTLSVSAINGLPGAVGSSIAGTYGTLLLGANGQYTYTLANGQANVRALNAGQTVTETFHYTLSDGQAHLVPRPSPWQNLISVSEAFDNAAWNRFSVPGTLPTVSADVALDPFGGSTAERMTLTGTAGGIYHNAAVSGQHSFSVWMRLASGDGHFSFNYYNGVANALQSAVATGEWQRFTFTFTGNGAGNGNVALMHDFAQSAAGVFEVWGAQLNAGATAQDYLPTTGTPLTITNPEPTELTVASTLTVSIHGTSEATTLNLETSERGVVANLATGEWSVPMSIMPFGDSITYGWRHEDDIGIRGESDGYRGPLWWNFAAQHLLIDFVGPLESGSARFPDPDHAGYPGERADELALRADQLAEMLPNLLGGDAPDAILLLVGTNDITQESTPQATIGQDIRGILNTIAAESPLIHVYVATAPPISSEHTNPTKVPAVNAAITTAVQQAIADGLNASLVSMSNLTLADLYDGKHPNEAGYAKIASNWINAILTEQAAVGGTPGGTAHGISASIRDVVGSAFNDLLIGGLGPNLLSGEGGNDRLLGGGGTDTLIGGAGADQFAFETQAGSVTVADFSTVENDALVFQGFSGLDEFSDISARVSQAGGSTIINLNPAGFALTITLAGFTGVIDDSNVWFA